MRSLDTLKNTAAGALEIPAKFFRRRHPPAGARPGTLVVDPEAPPTRMTLAVYSDEGVEEHVVADVEEISGLLQPGRKAWLDVVGLGSEEVLRALARHFGLHPLAIEDIVHVGQRPKIDSYAEHLLVVVRMLRPDESDLVVVEQLSLLLGRDYVLSFREGPGKVFDPVRRRLAEGAGPIRRSAGDYLAYALLDTVVDGYSPLLEDIGDEIDWLEESVMEDAHPALLERLTVVKRALLQLRRAVGPVRDALRAVVTGGDGFFTETTRTYLRDTQDHCAQAMDLVDAYREVTNGLFNTYLSAVGNRTNEIMRVLTIMASIFIPLTFLAGIYGMNFQHMPELNVWWSYPLVLGLMVGVALGMTIYFMRRGWVGSRRPGAGNPNRRRGLRDRAGRPDH
jgi:magnesium transporter